MAHLCWKTNKYNIAKSVVALDLSDRIFEKTEKIDFTLNMILEYGSYVTGYPSISVVGGYTPPRRLM